MPSLVSILNSIEHISTLQKAVWLFGVLSLGVVLESTLPFWKVQGGRLRHNLVNLIFLGFTFVINAVFSLLTVKIVYPWIVSKKIGLLYYLDWPIWAKLVLALLCFDFLAQYSVHYFLHKLRPLWRLHMIHHSDTKVMATTGTRHHPGDYIMREVFSLLTIVLTGAPFAYYMLYRLITIPFTYFTHVNVLFPAWIDRPLSYLFITPNVHKFHHHWKAPWTDSNYGNILSIWDRMFGTFVYDDPGEIRYGLDILDDEKDENVLYQLKVPFDPAVPSTMSSRSAS